MTKKDNFEDRLLTELRPVAEENPTPVETRRNFRPARFALAGGGLASAVAVIAIFAGSGENTSNAYAVDQNSDGNVNVKITSLKDAEGLEASLREAGVAAVVDYSLGTSDDCEMPSDQVKVEVAKTTPVTGESDATPGDEDSTSFTVHPGMLEKGQKLFITSQSEDVSTTSPTADEATDPEAMNIAMAIGTTSENPVC